MEYPIDEQCFADLINTRKELVKQNPFPQKTEIASPFVPWIGKEILKGSKGIYFVGKSTGKLWFKAETLEESRKYTEEFLQDVAEGFIITPFWQYVRQIVQEAYGVRLADGIQRIAWSNQLKIGVSRGEPTGKLKGLQLPLCRCIFKREQEIASNCALIFLGDGPLIPHEGWDTARLKRIHACVRSNLNGAPVIYQYHPKYLRIKINRLWKDHVTRIGGELKKWIQA